MTDVTFLQIVVGVLGFALAWVSWNFVSERRAKAKRDAEIRREMADDHARAERLASLKSYQAQLARRPTYLRDVNHGEDAKVGR